MDRDIFGDGRLIPPFIEEITEGANIRTMLPGEVTWTASHTLYLDEEEAILIDSGNNWVRRNETPTRGSNIKIIKDFDGMYLDLTGLSLEDIEVSLNSARHRHWSDEDDSEEERYVPVRGILFPDITETEGLEPAKAQVFNQEQARIRQKFADYYEKTYGSAYLFARDELLDRYDLLDLSPESESGPIKLLGIRVLRRFGLA